ncbi:LacI family DNA-binding transcriptional regulator [Celeribacter sp.]|uniref:LacI family DNA-binding transcriptional regulator n=1 Tax=Celeribacter sp. TaxID=1890673 RepID=UPI003A91B22E
MKNPTLHDVAALAGVSYATADRVVNRRGNVAEKSVRKVNDAVAQLGYVRNIAAAKLSKNRHHHLAFVLPDKSHDFFGRMHDQLAAAALHLKTAGVVLDVIEFEAFDARALEEALSGLIGKTYDGVAFVGQGLDKLSTSLTALRAEGMKIVTLVSDVPENNRDHYIGIDNVKAGRTAGRLIGFSHGGKAGHVVLTAGSLDLRDHSDRINGFREVIEADFPNIGISEVIETKDQAELMRKTLHQNLSDASPVTAIYNAGAGNEGLVRALHDRDPKGAIFCIVHELSTTVCDALQDGFVDVALDQRPEIEMNRALALLQAIADEMPPPPSPELIPAIYVRDNLPTEMN